MKADLPTFLRELLNAPPHAGEGLHNWLFRVARQLHAHCTAPEIVQLLEGLTRNCGRAVPAREIVAAVQNSLPCAWAPNSVGKYAASAPQSKWPAPNEERVAAIIKDGPGLVDLWELSPITKDQSIPWTEWIVDHLFPGNPLLCCGQTSSQFDTRPRDDWRGELDFQQFIVPSPMSKVAGKTKEGHASRHCLDNTGLRRFLVCEFDRGTVDEQTALLLHLARYGPLVCAVHSGGKSLHGWFFVAGEPEERVEKFFRYACSLGADPATWTRSQFVRMPDGRRENGRRQTVYFLNFEPLAVTR